MRGNECGVRGVLTWLQATRSEFDPTFGGDCLGAEGPIPEALYGCKALEEVGFMQNPKLTGGLSSRVGGLARLTRLPNPGSRLGRRLWSMSPRPPLWPRSRCGLWCRLWCGF